MKYISTFAELAAEVDDDGSRLNPSGVDELFNLFEWICAGGTLVNYPRGNIVTSQVILALAWIDARDSTLAREELEEK